MGFDNHFTLKESDAQAIFLGRLKGAKERMIKEFGIHATTVIRDGKDGPAVVLGRFDTDLASGCDCLPGVKYKVGYDFLHLLLVQEHCRQGMNGFYEINLRAGFDAGKDREHKFIEIRGDRFDLQTTPELAEPLDEMIDVGNSL